MESRPQHVEPEVNPLVEVQEHIRQRAEQLEEQYRSYGLTPESVRNRLLEIHEQLQKDIPDSLEFRDSLYVTPSDPLTMMERTFAENRRQGDLIDKKILTVAGGGDIPLVFALGQPEYVDSFDISIPGAFMTEAKIVAASVLSMTEYQKAFNPVDGYDEDSEDNHYTLIKPESYQKIRSLLTEQARTYFDTLLDTDTADLGSLRIQGNPNPMYRRAKFSEMQGFCEAPPINLYRLPERRNLPKKNRKFFLEDITSFDQERIEQYDYIFISNIGFSLDNQIPILRGLLQKGAKRIGFTIGGGEKGIRRSKDITVNYTAEKALEYEGVPLLPETTVHIDGLSIRIIFHDTYCLSDIPIYAEIWAEDNN